MSINTELTLYGPNWSAYTRTVRMVLAEKEVSYVLEEVDFSSGVMPAEHLKRHPFGKVPVLTHGEFVIYETSAICRYVDEAFGGVSLQPAGVQERARMAQIIAIIDSYLSEEIRMGYLVVGLNRSVRLALVSKFDCVDTLRSREWLHPIIFNRIGFFCLMT